MIIWRFENENLSPCKVRRCFNDAINFEFQILAQIVSICSIVDRYRLQARSTVPFDKFADDLVHPVRIKHQIEPTCFAGCVFLAVKCFYVRVAVYNCCASWKSIGNRGCIRLYYGLSVPILSTAGFSCVMDETFNRGHISIWLKLFSGT